MTTSFYYVACMAGIILLNLEILVFIGVYFVCQILPAPYDKYVSDIISVALTVVIISTLGLAHLRLYRYQYQGRKSMFNRVLPTKDDLLAFPWMLAQQKYSFYLIVDSILTFYRKLRKHG